MRRVTNYLISALPRINTRNAGFEHCRESEYRARDGFCGVSLDDTFYDMIYYVPNSVQFGGLEDHTLDEQLTAVLHGQGVLL